MEDNNKIINFNKITEVFRKINKQISNLEDRIDVLAKGPSSSDITYDGIRIHLTELYRDKELISEVIERQEGSNIISQFVSIDPSITKYIPELYIPELSDEEQDGGAYLNIGD
jgi:hypothetical protein